jgi:drug/metabolite transporter (DMT)-like permease
MSAGAGAVAEPATPLVNPFRAWDVLLLLTVGGAWGVAFVFIRQGILLGASPLAFASARYLLSALAFAVLAAARHERAPARRSLAISAGLGGIMVIGLYGGLLYWGEQYITGGYAAVLTATAPLLTVGIGFPLLASERFGPQGILGVAVGFVGATVLVLPGLFGSPLGTWEGPVFLLAAVGSFSLGTILLRKYGGGSQGLWQISSQFLIAGSMLGAGSFLVPGPRALPLVPGVLVPLAILVLLSSVVGYFAYYALSHRVGPLRANLVAYVNPIIGVVVGVLLLAEPVTIWEIGGVAIVLVGVTLVLRESASHH